MKQSVVQISVIAWMVTACGCSPPSNAGPLPNKSDAEATDPMRFNFGRKNEPNDFTAICRFEFDEPPAVSAALDFTLEHGGYTCHSNNKDILFVPQRDGHCPKPDGASSAERVLSVDDASREYQSCAAWGQIGATSETGVITFQPRSTGPEGSDRDFQTFGFNLIALSGHDALPITSLSWSGDVVCIEASNPSLALQRIVESDIADPSDYRATVHRGTCRVIGARLTGAGWPYRLPD